MAKLLPLLAVMLFGFPKATVAQLKITVEFEKKDYFVAEPVFVILSVENTTPSTVELNPFLIEGGDLNLELVDAAGKKLQYLGPVATSLTKPTIKLEPGEKRQKIYDLMRMYGQLISISFRQFELSPGKYRIRAIYTAFDNQMFTSSSENFEVRMPNGDEFLAYNEFRQTLRNLDKELFSDSQLHEAQFFISNTENYPLSVYSPLSLTFAATIYKVSATDIQRSNEIYKRIIKEYPNSGMIQNALANLKQEIARQPDSAVIFEDLKRAVQGKVSKTIIRIFEKKQ